MPIHPGGDETESQWMGRCVPEMMDGGREQDQAVAICLDIWRREAEASRSDRFARIRAVLARLGPPPGT